MKVDTPEGHLDVPGLAKSALGGLKVLNIAAAVAIGTMLLTSIVASEFLFGALGIQANPWGTATMSMRGIMAVGLAGAYIAHRVLSGLQHLVESVRAGDPFVPDNAAHLQAIAWWLTAGAVFHLLVGALERLASTSLQPLDLDWSFSFTPWVTALLVFVLVRVFEHGARLRGRAEATA